jgi:PAS domain S-box-containing protein
LHHAEEHVGLAVASTGLGTWDFDVASGRLVWSDLCKRHFGLSPDREVDLATFLSGVHPADRERINGIVKEAYMGLRERFDAEYRTIGIEDEQERWIAGMGSVFFDGEGRPVRFLGTTLDITERKRIEEETRRSREWLSVTLGSIAEGVVAMDTSGKIALLNAAAEQLIGCQAEEAIGRPIQDVFRFRDERSLETPVDIAGDVLRESAGAPPNHTLLTTRNGREIAIDTTAAPIADREGNVAGVVFVFRDVTATRQAQAELLAAHEDVVLQKNRMRAVLDALPAGVSVVDALGGTVECNAAFEQVWGGPIPPSRSVAEYRKYKAWWVDSGKLVEPEEWASALAVQKGETTIDQEIEIQRFDGGRAFVLNSAAPIRDAHGRISGSAVTIRDVTSLKRAEEAVREREQQLISIYNTVRDVVFYLGVEPSGEFRFLSVNESFLGITGLGRDQVVGKRVSDVIPEPSLSMVLGKYRQAIETKAPVFWEETSDYPSGRLTGEVNVAPVFDDEGNCTHLVGSVHDVTARKRAEAELRESEERFRTVADTAPVMIWMSGLDQLYTFFNRPWLEFTGRTMDQELGNGWVRGVHPEDLDRCQALYSVSFEARRRFQREYRLRRGDGEYRQVLESGTPLYREGEFAGYIGSCIDVTDARRAQEESFSRQKLESLGTLASGIAHDFNNLLGAVLAQAELAMAEAASGARPDEELKGIRDVAIRGSEIVRQLMIYAGKEEDIPELTDVSQAVEGMMGLLNVSVSRHATLVTDLEKKLPRIKARPAQLRQIVMNLVVNASDAIKDHDGIIRVATRHLTVDGGAELSDSLVPGEYVELDVSDTGSGMAPETQARVFDPFFTTKSAGRGLGLAVVQGVVRSLNGAIRVTSELGSGTTFQILLPCAGAADRTASDAGAGVNEPAAPAREATVLVVEDEHPLRAAITKMLGKAGFQVLQAGNGSEAIELLRDNAAEIDVVLLDMTIPGSPSHEVFAKALQVKPEIKIITTSAYSEETVKTALNGASASGFVRKPFRFADLVRSIRSVLAVEKGA